MLDNAPRPRRQLISEEAGKGLDQRHVLCLLLLLEKARGAESQWAVYIDLLPQRYGEGPYAVHASTLLHCESVIVSISSCR